MNTREVFGTAVFSKGGWSPKIVASVITAQLLFFGLVGYLFDFFPVFFWVLVVFFLYLAANRVQCFMIDLHGELPRIIKFFHFVGLWVCSFALLGLIALLLASIGKLAGFWSVVPLALIWYWLHREFVAHRARSD